MITKAFPLISWFIYMKGKCFAIIESASRCARGAGCRMAIAGTANPLSKRIALRTSNELTGSKADMSGRIAP